MIIRAGEPEKIAGSREHAIIILCVFWNTVSVYNLSMPFARVAVNVPTVHGEFDYALPPELDGRVGMGHLVRVPFGSQIAQGVVLQLVDQAAVAVTKPVQELLDPRPVLSSHQIELARQMAASTLNPLAAMIELMLPPGLSQHVDQVYSLTERWKSSRELLNKFPEIQKRLVALMETRGALRGRQIDRHFLRVDWRKSAAGLVKQGVLFQQSILPPPSVRPKFIRTAQLAVTPEQAEAAMLTLAKLPAILQRRQNALRFLIHEPESVAVTWVYAESGCNLADLQELAERELIVLSEFEIFRDPLARLGAQILPTHMAGKADPELTGEQQIALAQILAAMQSQGTGESEPGSSFLLYGVTGSGKTEIYLRAVTEALHRGKSAVILVPEIAITPQIVRRFLAHFPGQVGLVHSQLSEGERYDTWRRARNGQLKVIIGARSALFTPLPDLGLIVVDECHDNSYYQSDPPFYHAVSAAEMYARVCGAVCIMGSATPSIELRYRSLQTGAQSGLHKIHNLELSRRFQTSGAGGSLGEMPPVSIVDIRDELKNGNRGIFSRALAENLAAALQRGEQAILYLNRRGSATYVFCHECGHVLKCPNCDIPLTQHDAPIPVSSLTRQESPRGKQSLLVCHRCGYTRPVPGACPNCKSTQIKAYGLGSEKVESEVKRLLPNARILRWDWETTREKDSHELILTHFANHQADVLVGTQMLAKGLDLPLVTLVGIVLADVGLSLPDPFVNERAFQLLTQVAGRAGRSDRGGRVILQTYMPEHPIIQMAARHDYNAFYQWEIENRHELGYPPFAKIVRLEHRHFDPLEVEKQARLLADKIKRLLEVGNYTETRLIGPAPCFFSRVNNQYCWQIMLVGPEPANVIKGQILDGWRVEVQPVSLL